MKNIKYIIILIALIFPFVVNAATCQPEKVTIKKVTIEDISDNTEELKEPDINGREIGVNLKFQEVGDYITYKVLIRNDSDEDFEIDSNSININKDYMEYSVITNDKIIKANEEKTIELRVSYKTEVDSSKFVNGRYQDDQKMQLNLSNDAETPVVPANPATNNNRIIILILVLSGILIIVFSKQKLSSRNKMMLIMGMILIPITAKAVCKCQIDLNSHIEIERINEACIYIEEADCLPGNFSKHERINVAYTDEMTLREFLNKVYETLDEKSNSVYNNDFRQNDLPLRFINKSVEKCEEEADKQYKNSNNHQEYYNSMLSCHNLTSENSVIENDYTVPVKNKSLGCYDLTTPSVC